MYGVLHISALAAVYLAYERGERGILRLVLKTARKIPVTRFLEMQRFSLNYVWQFLY